MPELWARARVKRAATPTSMAQLVERPPAKCEVAGLIPGQDIVYAAGPGLRWGACGGGMCGRQLIDVSLTH